MDFYRATRTHSADYAVARCPSVTRRYSVETAKHILKLVSPWRSPPPLTGASNASRVKNCDFRPIYRFISEMIRYAALLI